MVRDQLNGRDSRLSALENNGSFVVSERSPLLRALREDSTSYEGTYMSMPAPSSMESRLSEVGQFQPIIYAEKSLAALLTGVLMYAICCIFGLGLVSLNFEGILGDRVNWWLIFLPFWLANVCILVGHIQSIRHAKKLRQWAEVDSMSNEPLLPLLRRIVMIYAISFPLSVLLLWSELAFCARLENSGTSLYICYAPIMVIQVAFVIRYLLCRSDSTVPVRSMLLPIRVSVMALMQRLTAMEYVCRESAGSCASCSPYCSRIKPTRSANSTPQKCSTRCRGGPCLRHCLRSKRSWCAAWCSCSTTSSLVFIA